MYGMQLTWINDLIVNFYHFNKEKRKSPRRKARKKNENKKGLQERVQS
jgi:hypothetical protein